MEDTGTCDILKTGILEKSLKFISTVIEEGGCVLVHCQAGMSRSGAIAVAYLMKTQNLSYADALASVKQARRCVAPNGNFEQQIKKYFEAIRPKPVKVAPIKVEPVPEVQPKLNLTPTIQTSLHSVYSRLMPDIFMK